MKKFCGIILLTLIISQCRPKEENTITEFSGKPEVPSSIKEVHEHLLNVVHGVTLLHDSTGHAAIKLNELMQHHFKEEEDFVLPPLGLLPSLAKGVMPEQSKNVILLTEKLKAQLDHLSAEHQMIKAFVDEMMLAANKEHHPEISEFEKELHKHAQTEEEVFFPAAILVGEYLKLRSMPKQ